MVCRMCGEPAVYKKRVLCSKHYHHEVKSEGSIRSHTPEYYAWANMRRRCNNKHDVGYKDYGARGITVCERWNDFNLFLADMGYKPTSQHSLDRIDNNKGYSPDNCRWATGSQQVINRRACYISAARLQELLDKEQELFQLKERALSTTPLDEAKQR